jgi:hypothetical protein
MPLIYSTFGQSFVGWLWAKNLWTVKPWYRELNIMNRVLNKDFGTESYNNSTLIAFSGVFHPACCMQNYPVNGMEGSAGRSFRLYEEQALKSRTSRKGESDEEQ